MDTIAVSTNEGERCCTKCGNCYPLTELNWYRARPRKGHTKSGWQSYCKDCWRDINRGNRERRRLNKLPGCKRCDIALVLGLIDAVEDFFKVSDDKEQEQAIETLRELIRKIRTNTVAV